MHFFSHYFLSRHNHIIRLWAVALQRQ